MRATGQYESYHEKSEGPILNCDETSEEQLEPGERQISVPANGCTGWFIFNPDPANPTFKYHWHWEPDGEVLEEMEDRGGYGTFTESPGHGIQLYGDRLKGVRFKGLGKPVTVTFLVGDIWSVTVLRNDTNGPIPYQILQNDGSWETFTLSPGYHRVHTWRNGNCFCIKYDYKYEAGYQEKKYDLQVTKTVGREPTEDEKEKSKVNYFKKDANGDIELYAAP
ncbi:MAG: hypothetical protein M3444_00265 [Acidobacteriota bacterium]|nr:hypothetical protein [Acidobacteriota bacterium]